MNINFVKRLSSICLLIVIIVQYIPYFSRLSNFCFFGTSFRSQNIRNTQIIYPLWCYVNLFKWEKMTDAIKKNIDFPVFATIVTRKKIGYTVSSSSLQLKKSNLQKYVMIKWLINNLLSFVMRNFLEKIKVIAIRCLRNK